MKEEGNRRTNRRYRVGIFVGGKKKKKSIAQTGQRIRGLSFIGVYGTDTRDLCGIQRQPPRVRDDTGEKMCTTAAHTTRAHESAGPHKAFNQSNAVPLTYPRLPCTVAAVATVHVGMNNVVVVHASICFIDWIRRRPPTRTLTFVEILFRARGRAQIYAPGLFVRRPLAARRANYRGYPCRTLVSPWPTRLEFPESPVQEYYRSITAGTTSTYGS